MAMNDTEETTGQLTPLESEAHAWVRRLVSGEATALDAQALRRWCDQSPAHAAAFSAASQFWTAFGPVGRSLLGEESTATRADGLPPRHRMIGRRAFLGGALAASAAGLF